MNVKSIMTFNSILGILGTKNYCYNFSKRELLSIPFLGF